MCIYIYVRIFVRVRVRDALFSSTRRGVSKFMNSRGKKLLSLSHARARTSEKEKAINVKVRMGANIFLVTFSLILFFF